MTMVCWAGNVGHDVQYRQIDENIGVANFNLAVTPRVRNAQGLWEDGTTTWVRVAAWRLLGEHVRDSVKKGDAVIVYGRLETRRWVDDNKITRDDLTLEATSVGHDLRRGIAEFQRTGRPAPEVAPRFESAAAAELAALEAAEEAAMRGAEPQPEPVPVP